MDSLPADNGTPGGADHSKPLPPVEPPSALFILQLFVVPGVLVAVIVAFIIVFFGWIGGGPETPEQFMEGLKSPSGMKRGKTAQDLAQVLPRKQELRGNVSFALDLADLLDQETQKPPTVPDPTRDEPYLLEFYLPSAAGSFHVPTALPILAKLAIESKDRMAGDEAYRLRMRNAIFALALLGARLKEFDGLPADDKARIVAELREASKSPDAARARRASQAAEVLEQRLSARGESGDKELVPPFVANALEAGSTAPDELTRKYAILALANWEGSATERLLLQLCGSQEDLPDAGFETGDRPFSSKDRERGSREIRQNAALALARRGSKQTPWDLVLETLNQDQLAREQYADNPGMAISWTLKALKDLDQLRQAHPERLTAQPEVIAAVTRLATESPTVVVRVEAQKLLGGVPELAGTQTRTSRELLLIGGIGVSVLLLLGLAVFARWRRAAT